MILGVWAGLYVITAVTVGQVDPGACLGGGGNLVALVPAVLSFAGAVLIAWLNRPTRPRRRRRA